MAKRRGNPNWGKPEMNGPVTPTITEFEQVTREFNLQPEQHIHSTQASRLGESQQEPEIHSGTSFGGMGGSG